MTLSAIILAAGKATRMKSDRVKVLHEVCGRPMLAYVLDACRKAGVQKLYLVVGHDRERVMETFKNDNDITWVTQTEQKGTGHAVMVCREAFKDLEGDTFVLCGDGPLIRAETLQQLLATHREKDAAVTLATCNLPDPTGYGRIMRDAAGNLLGIVEHNDATPAQRAITEVNPSYYVYRTANLFESLQHLKPNNKKGEYYLTDTLELLRKSGHKLAAVPAVPPEDVLSINTRSDLADVNRVMQVRIQKQIMDSGVTLLSPENTWIEHGAQIGQDSVVGPFIWMGYGTKIPAGTRVMPSAERLVVFGGRANMPLSKAICEHMGLSLGRARVDSFPDGEVIVKLEQDVRGRDCFVIQPTCTPVNENLMELLVWIDCLKRASAERITAVLPYFGYARQDRKSEGRTPITAKLVANLITAAGADRVIAMDLHAAQVQGFFDIPMDHLLASPVFSDYYKAEAPKLGKIAVVSPDPGNLKVGAYYAELLGADLAFIDKRRKSATSVAMSTIIGDVAGKTVLMFDDMVATGGTVCEAARFLKEHGATDIHVAATHGLFSGSAVDKLVKSPISQIVVTDTVPVDGRLAPLGDRIKVLSVANILGAAIHRIHMNQSVSSLFDKGGNAGKR